MTYQRFEDLPVWNEAIRLGELVYTLTGSECFEGLNSFKDQLERAAVSVSNNIAEGFERGSTTELIQFIYYSRGSAAEVRSMLLLAGRMKKLGNLKAEMSNLRSIAESCSRQLRAWADSLQNSEIKGPKFLNDKTRDQFERQTRVRNARQRIFEMLPESHPLRVEAGRREEPD